MKKVYLLLADGFEALEAVAPLDVMQRAGVTVERVSISTSTTVTSSHHLVQLHADRVLGEALLEDGDAIILPGGYPGYANLAASEAVGRVVRYYEQAGKYVAALCGAPTVLAVNQVATGKRLTAHFSVVPQLTEYEFVGGEVVQDGTLITGAGAGVAVTFTLTLLEQLTDAQTVLKVKKGMELL
ncbi:MAG: DJ-1/PfpI family protein [Alistipes sp.]|nr:DJ-1/PfpI family protein [Alistipes sp.]